MDTTYTSTFPCKVISSFYDNYYGVHKYDDIKKITFRIQNNDTNFNQEILNYFKPGIRVFEWLDRYLIKFKEMASSESYLFFLLLTIYLTRQYNYPCVPPANLYEVYQTIKNVNSRIYFLYSYFNTLFINNNENKK